MTIVAKVENETIYSAMRASTIPSQRQARNSCFFFFTPSGVESYPAITSTGRDKVSQGQTLSSKQSGLPNSLHARPLSRASEANRQTDTFTHARSISFSQEILGTIYKMM
ncbi:hypothetical protein H0G86_010877 [Trichoderma simmonsii]|uniref:Uncharacterized protein n=1 Tax=Trichoderma simmonsii TaxID=1491479 RepID=A0A8G0PLS2_9HYPO|nr:hypothetical protein H0G86_010877 [Trichoderma simmonsii]